MNRTKLIAVFAIFFIPVVLAVLLNSQWLDWRPGETRNHGELIEPALPLPAFELRDADGRRLTRETLGGHWQLLHFRDTPCADDCLEALYWMRQVRKAQDRHQDEIELLLVTTEPVDSAARSAIAELAEDYRVIAGKAGRRFAEWLPDGGFGGSSYIVDPRGHIILHYPQSADFNGMRRDLRRLLTWTQPAPE